MPKYELCVIMKCLERPELLSAVKSVSSSILTKGGVLRSLENLGARDLPYRMYKHGQMHRKGHYMVVQFDSSVPAMLSVKEELSRDLSIIRRKLLRREEELRRPCDDGPCDFGEMTDEMRTRLHQQLKDYVKKL